MIAHYRNAEIHYSTAGTGNPLVLLHGFLESGRIWADIVPHLIPKRQVIIPDLPGHGGSGCFSDVHTMEGMAEAVQRVLQQEKIEQADFIGHSMGGYVALALMEQQPGLFRKLFLLNSTPAADSPERKANRERAVELIQRNKGIFVSMAISNLLTEKNNKRYEKEINLLKEEALQFPTEGITAALKGMKIRTNRKEVLKAFEGEKYILSGKEDPILNYLEIKQIAKECHCRFIGFKDGHLSYLENKDELLQFVHFVE